MKQESESGPEAQDKQEVSTDEDRRATHEEGMDKSLAVAPAELRAVVPLVVEVVRRYTSNRTPGAVCVRSRGCRCAGRRYLVWTGVGSLFLSVTGGADGCLGGDAVGDSCPKRSNRWVVCRHAMVRTHTEATGHV